jgi:alanine racemase
MITAPWRQAPDPASPALSPDERAWVEIDFSALAHNVRQLRQFLSPTTDLMAVVKADAYGHGAIGVAQVALEHGVSWLGVATIQEGIALRQAGIQAPILLLGAAYTSEQIQAIAYWRLQPTISSYQQAVIASETLTALQTSLPVHLKLDTGMSRLGCPWQDAVQFVQQVRQLPGLEIASLYSHLATADDPNSDFMQLQHQRFQHAVDQIQANGITLPRLHLANSAATIADRHLHYDLVRVGLATYGLYPALHLQAQLDLQPVMQVKARITEIKTLQKGTGVSYGHRYVADRELRMAVAGIGYADGVPRCLSNQMTVLIRGQRIAQIGTITMDQLMLDVTTIPDLKVGDVVTLLGREGQHSISAEDWATAVGTIAWEIVCGFKHRLPRLAVNAS